MKIDCLMGTSGRYTLACEALACFLNQTSLSSATLLIYNQHRTPLHFDHPRVRIVNEVPLAQSLRHIRKRMHDLADPGADLIHWWDDDDLYLPWHLSDCLDHIEDHVAWKPESCWMSKANVQFGRYKNRFEGSWVFRADYLKNAPLDTDPDYTDHPVILQTAKAGLLATTELGGRTSYIYRWNTGTEHLSGYGAGGDGQQRAFVALWRLRSNDAPEHGLLAPTDLSQRWRQYLDGIRCQVTPEEWEFNRIGVGLSVKVRDK